jgi:ATP-binding cassette, subfamily B, bacterial
VADDVESSTDTDTDDSEPRPRVPLRELPRLVRTGLSIAWSAGRTDLIVSTALQVVGGFAIVAMLLLGRGALAALLDAVAHHRSLLTLLPWVLGSAAVAVVGFFASAIQRERQQILGDLVSRYIEGKVLDVTAVVDLAMFDTPEFHNRVQRVNSSGNQPLNMVYGLSGLIGSGVGLVGALVALVAIAPLLIPLLVLVILPAWLAASRRGEAFYELFWKMTARDRQRHYLSRLLTDRAAAKEVRAFGLARHLRNRYNTLYAERIAELRRVARRQMLFAFGANVVIGAMLAATLLTVGWLALRGTVPLASAGIAVAGVAVVAQRLTMAGWAAGSLSEAGRYLDDYLAFVALLPEVEAARPRGAMPPRGFRRLRVRGVTFIYPTGTEPALRDVSLDVSAGEVVALVGENGSGKTTLAKLLAGLYHPDHGTITWDDTDVSTVDPDELRRSIAVIFQDFERFHVTAGENIGLGRVSAVDDDAGIRAAAMQAGADSFIGALKKGYATMLGPEFLGGTDLSVGQWQRMALARAFFRSAPFVILDEPTAALDPRAEQELFDRIRSLLAERTVLIISHRFSSVRSADRIYVLAEGRVIESGDHDTLVALGGRYAELFTLQAAAYLDAKESRL